MKAKNVQDVYELTPLQQGLLFHCLQAPAAGLYVEQMYLLLRGEVRMDALREAWQAMITRHPSLRTSFFWEDINHPVQVVHQSVRLPLSEVDLSGLDPQEQEERFGRHMLAERRRGFDLEAAPLLRVTVFRMSEHTYRLALRFHHLIMDGWSFGLIMQDFITLYKAAYHGRAVKLPEPRTMREYVRWWNRQDSASVRDYWTDQLTGYLPPPALDLGDDDPSTNDTVTHGFVEWSLADIAGRLREFSRKHRLTLNTLVQGAWSLVLSRCYGTEDVVIGATIAHRPHEIPDCESIVGPLIVTMPIRARVRAEQAVGEWLRGIQATIIGARDHEVAALPEIHGWSETPHSVPLFETIVSFENVPIPEISFAEENMEILGHWVDGRPQYAMSLDVLPGEDMALHLVYDRRRFSAETALRMLDRVRTALLAFVADLEREVGKVDIVSTAERADILGHLRRRERLSVHGSLYDAVHEHAQRSPDRVAVTGDGEELTYRELLDHAGRLTRLLRQRGVRPGDRVAICAERSPRLVVGILGILGCAAAYVPLDPDNPDERLAFVLRDCEATALLTETDLVDGFERAQHEPGPSILLLDAELPGLDAGDQKHQEHLESQPDDVAYVMYTSGSTGQPKGVLVTHANMLRLVAAAHREFTLDSDDVWSMFFSPAFDGAAWEMWGALTRGARLVVVPYWVSRSPDELLALLARERVTICTQSPSAFRQLIAVDMAAEQRLALRIVVLGGEKVEPASMTGWFARHGDETWIVNAYGPTEATVWVCYHRLVGAETTDPKARSLIGRPLVDTSIHLLDSGGLLVPFGAPGEMYLAGPGVAAGYLNRPDLSARSFLPDVFDEDPDGRMYASGDLARLTARGELDYVGRVDAQVKVRGFRVELGEVENRLREHSGVRGAVATVCPDSLGGQRLLAYVAPAEDLDGADLTEELRRFCAAALPEYMVPSAITVLTEIPLTGNGKVDHRALPAIEGRDDEDSYIAPRNDTERRMAEIFRELLGVQRVGVEDDLSERGLHSLLAIQAVNKVRSTWGVRIPVRALFESATVASLAATVTAGGAQPGTADRPGRVDLAQEAVLDDDIVLNGKGEWVSEPAHVFLTGCTGFPGAYLAAELIRTTGATLHCLIRAGNAEQAGRRLRQHFESLRLWDESFEDRLVAVPGDLALPFFGLPREEFEQLASLVDEIYHFGALVNFVYPYRRLRAANVQGTKEVLRLAMLRRSSTVHHISGMGVFPAGPAANGHAAHAEVELPVEVPALPNGYSETKWVAERLVSIASDRGLPVVVHRLGRVTGDSRTGVWNAAGDALGEMIKASAGLGLLPAYDGCLDMVPVDYVAAAVAALARRPDAVGNVFHLVNPKPVGFENFRSGFGLARYPVETVDLADWYAELVRRSADAVGTGEDWSVPITLLSDWLRNAGQGIAEPSFDATRTAEFLGDAVACPDVDGAVLCRYLGYLADTGFIPPPNVMEQS